MSAWSVVRQEVTGNFQLMGRTLYFVFNGKSDVRRSLTYMYEMGNQSLLFLCVVMGFIGMIVVYQAGVQVQRMIPDMSELGTTYLELLVKDSAATIAALMLATRVGAGIAAEIGSMVVTEQVDALRMCAADPVDYLVRPRFVASLVTTLVLVVIAGSVAAVTGMFTAQAFFGVSHETFLNFREIDAGDVITGLSKALAYGASTPIVSAYSGLSTFGGSEGVGTATTRAVVNSSLAIIVLDFLLTTLGYLVFG